jgi:hypothetical protein
VRGFGGVSYPPNPYLSKFLIFNFPKLEEFGGKREGSSFTYFKKMLIINFIFMM